MALNPRGSLWSKWDLHVHSPSSIIHQYPGGSDAAWERFISDLGSLPSEFKVVGINDYLFLEGYERVRKERAAGRLQNLALVLPVVELRLNIFGGTESKLSRVNFHVIFSDELEPEIIREQFLSALSPKFDLVPRLHGTGVDSAWSGVVSRRALEHFGRAVIDSVPEDKHSKYGAPLREGFNNLTIPLDTVHDALSSSFLQGKFVTAVGKTEWADIKWKDGSIADKKNVVNTVDCLFTAAESASAHQRARRKLRGGKVNDRLLDCSDAHYLSDSDQKDRIGNCLTWIKADPTFGGLLQALEEYDQRVFTGDQPPQKQRVADHPSKYIDRVRISKGTERKSAHEWFSVDLPLNSGLVAVIGNKGSGKSALAEVIGLTCGAPHEEHFSFLTGSKFRNPRQRLADRFIGEVLWHTGDAQSARLSDHVETGSRTTVQHLPQRYLETLCNEVPTGEKTEFDAELERIIFAHLPTDRRLGATSLGELLQITTGSIDTELAEKRSALKEINVKIATLEDLTRPEVRSARLSAYRTLRQEWFTLRESAPVEVPEPDESDPSFSEIRDYIRDLGMAQHHLARLLEEYESDLALVRRNQADLSSFRTKLETLKREHDSLREENGDLLARLEIPDSVSELTIDTHILDAARSKLATAERDLLDMLDDPDGGERGLESALRSIESEIKSEQATLSAPEEARENYLTRRREWEHEVSTLRGPLNSTGPQTLLGARRAYFELRNVPDRLEALREERRSIAGGIHELLIKEAVSSSALYEPLQRYMNDQQLPDDYQISVGTSLVDTGFVDTFLEEFVNRQVAGSFCGVAESQKRLGDLISGVDFDDKESVLAFLDDIDTHLHLDMRQAPSTITAPEDQIRKGKTVADLYNWIYSLSYLSPRYGLMFGGKPIYQLSPGEKGTLLLLFFLLAEVDTRPLIIDQPEDNLDNNTVYRALVHCFQIAKDQRQVVIITHNPNLAVVCDADQVIVASMDKEGTHKITYRPGAIERKDTVQAIVDILEGTQPAFSNRSVKYTLHLINR